jgi:hypothetical protein
MSRRWSAKVVLDPRAGAIIRHEPRLAFAQGLEG